MRILAIETSCDETAIAIIEAKKNGDFEVLANLVSSQIKVHEKFGGVVPNLARREHERNLVPVLIRSLKGAGLWQMASDKKLFASRYSLVAKILEREPILREKFIKFVLPIAAPKIDAIAVTYGPGLAPALWAGVNFAKALAIIWSAGRRMQLIPVNHMEGHIFSSLIEARKNVSKKTNRYSLVAIRYPAIALLVSGGHTEIHLVKKLGNYRRLGETIDDAAGEAFDKVAKMLGLKYPGGPEISKLAEKGDPQAVNFPRPLWRDKNYNFSFSGLKTSVLYYIRDHKNYSTKDVAASFEAAAVDVLVSKTIRAAKEYGAKTILIGGGVAANKKLKEILAKKISRELPGVKFLVPYITNTGDNALMIALAAAYGKNKIAPNSAKAIGAVPNLKL